MKLLTLCVITFFYVIIALAILIKSIFFVSISVLMGHWINVLVGFGLILFLILIGVFLIKQTGKAFNQ
jgi:hypothetical protein